MDTGGVSRSTLPVAISTLPEDAAFYWRLWIALLKTSLYFVSNASQTNSYKLAHLKAHEGARDTYKGKKSSNV